MTKRMRELRKVERPTFAERLESNARRIVKDHWRDRSSSVATSTLERELALTVSQIDGVRRMHRQLRRDLGRIECYIDTEIIQREPRDPVYTDPRLPERDMLRARLLKIEHERRRLTLIENDKLRELQDRLLSLISKHRNILP